jgi:hypothetical protein
MKINWRETQYKLVHQTWSSINNFKQETLAQELGNFYFIIIRSIWNAFSIFTAE